MRDSAGVNQDKGRGEEGQTVQKRSWREMLISLAEQSLSRELMQMKLSAVNTKRFNATLIIIA